MIKYNNLIKSNKIRLEDTSYIKFVLEDIINLKSKIKVADNFLIKI
jgi:hypothetical protein